MADQNYQIIQGHEEHIKELCAENARLREVNANLARVLIDVLPQIEGMKSWLHSSGQPYVAKSADPSIEQIQNAIALAEKEA